jgi:hypothetical protein
MRRFLPSLILPVTLAALSLMAHAQAIPVSSGNRWAYINSDRSDTEQVTIVGKSPLHVSCRRGLQRVAAWVATDRYVYLSLAGGIVVAERREGSGGDTTDVPLFFVPGSLKRGAVPTPLRQDCGGTYSFIGFAVVTTPAGVFDACLIFDDRSVHRLFVAPGVGIVKEERYRESGGEVTAAERTVLWTRTLVSFTPSRSSH